MPALPPPVLAPRRKTRKIKVGKVEVGGDAPDLRAVDVHDADDRHQLHAAADRRADRVGLRHRAGRVPDPGRRRRAARDRAQVADPRDRRHPLPAEVRLRRDRRRLCRCSRQPRQHPQVRRPGQADRGGGQGRRQSRSGSASTPARSTRACSRSTGRPRPRRSSSPRSGRHRSSRSTTSTTSRSRSSTTTPSSWSRPTSCSPSAATGRCTSASPRPGPAFQGTIKSATAFGALLSKGIGDTIRVSLSAPPVEEVKVGNQILQSLNLKPASSRSCRAPRAVGPRSTSTSSPTRSPRASRA